MGQPINRLDKFFTENEYQYYLDLGVEYMGHANQKIILYKVDISKSDIDDLYGESSIGDLSFFPPIEIPAVVKIESSSTDPIIADKGAYRVEEYGKMQISVLSNVLSKMNIEISVGDYVGYAVDESNLIYFEISKIANKQIDNEKTFMGYKYYWQSFEAVPTRTLPEDFK